MKFIILKLKREMKFIIIIYTTNKLTIVEMEDIRGVRLRKFKLSKIILGVRMHFRHIYNSMLKANVQLYILFFINKQIGVCNEDHRGLYQYSGCFVEIGRKLF